MRRFAQWRLVLLLWATLQSLAHAQTRDPAAAQALFDQARELMVQGEIEQACREFAESLRLDPGIGTQFQLANCLEREGKLASAWAAFLEVASAARATGQDARERVASERAQALQGRIPKLVIDVPESTRVAGLALRRDDVPLDGITWGMPIPVDPGPHRIVVSAPDKQDQVFELVLAQSETRRLQLEPLRDVVPAASAAPSPAAAETRPVPLRGEANAESDRDKGSVARPWAWVFGGVGVAGLGAGAVFTWLANDANDESKAHCRADDVNACTARGLDWRDRAIARGNVATVAGVAGGALLVSGVVLWLLDGGEAQPRPKPAAGARFGMQPKAALGWLGVEGQF